MKLRQLRAALAKVDASHDDKEVLVWLPGSIIDLGEGLMSITDKRGVLIEGNVRRGSALDLL